ncbi:MAG: TIGR04086 family membrane protein [Defluviitaleaceae bacterium]|nr:TIGR04086 family membrane protein [Defluviitaleaceae bacterium]
MIQSQSKQFKALMVGVVMGYAITCIVFLGYSMLITYTSMTERNLPMVVAVTTLLSVMVAGFDAAKGAENRGWLWGMGAGLVYIIILTLLMMSVLQRFAVDTRTITSIILALAGGGMGGILGINMRRSR